MGNENPIRTLGDYYKPSHEGYRNTIELPVGNNVVPLRSDTIRLVQNGCSFYGLRSKDPNQHLKDFLKLVDSLDLDGENRERTRLCLFQFSLRDQASNWLERLPAIVLKGSRCTKVQRAYGAFRRGADQGGGFMNMSRIKLKPSSTHVIQAYAESFYSNPHPRNQNEPPKQSPFTFCERTGPIPLPQALGTTFKARVRDYMAAHTERIKRFENAIFKQRKEINDRMTKIFGLLKELTTSRAPKKVLIRVEVKFLITKNVNSISLTIGEEERSKVTDVTTDDDFKKPTKTKTEMPVKEVEKEDEAENELNIKAKKKKQPRNLALNLLNIT
nr:MAK10-like protein [Tanacetum cinerariifolium]